jgi:type II secretory pathway pseudopilin PulG
MKPWLIALIIVLVVVAVILGLLYYFGNKMQKKASENQAQMEAASQTVSMLVIDKKRMKLNEAGLPQAVLDQTPKYMRRSKVPIAKVKVGPQILNMICDEKVFEILPIKKEVKATVSGIYIMGVKGLRSNLEKPEKKKGFWRKLQDKARNTLEEQRQTEESSKKKKKK